MTSEVRLAGVLSPLDTLPREGHGARWWLAGELGPPGVTRWEELPQITARWIGRPWIAFAVVLFDSQYVVDDQFQCIVGAGWKHILTEADGDLG